MITICSGRGYAPAFFLSGRLKKSVYILIPLIWVCFWPITTVARGTYQEPKDFIHDVFNGRPPESSRLWIRNDLKDGVREILGHDLGVLRIRYWGKDGRSAWIVEEIGKDKLITAGIVVNQDHIEQVKVLVFRETRGWEVRYPFFTDQFKGIKLNSEYELNESIDGISGATLSVRALTKLTRLALYLHTSANVSSGGRE